VTFAERAQAARLPTLYASGTNTEKPAETPLPVRRDRAKAMLQRKNAAPERRVFAFDAGLASFCSNQPAAAAGMSRWRFMTILLSAPR
jgi:hypothetical protein